MSELYEDPSYLYYHPPLDLQSLTSKELLEQGAHYMDPFLVRLAHERAVVEGAERLLEELSEAEGNS